MNLDATHEGFLTEIVSTTVAKWDSTGSSSAAHLAASRQLRRSGKAELLMGSPAWGSHNMGELSLSWVGKVLERSSSASKSSREDLEANTYLFTHPNTYKMDSWSQLLSSLK